MCTCSFTPPPASGITPRCLWRKSYASWNLVTEPGNRRKPAANPAGTCGEQQWRYAVLAREGEEIQIGVYPCNTCRGCFPAGGVRREPPAHPRTPSRPRPQPCLQNLQERSMPSPWCREPHCYLWGSREDISRVGHGHYPTRSVAVRNSLEATADHRCSCSRQYSPPRRNGSSATLRYIHVKYGTNRVKSKTDLFYRSISHTNGSGESNIDGCLGTPTTPA
jgi:hypothetical protein